MTQYQAIRSRALTGDELADIITQFEKRHRKLGLNSYRKDGSTCDLLCRTLPSLDPFSEIFYAHMASLSETPTDAATLKKLALEWGPASRKHVLLGWRVQGVNFCGETDRTSQFTAGLDRFGYCCMISCALDENVGYNDRQVRARFFEDIIATLDLSRHIRTHWEGDRFRLDASAPWGLECIVGELRGWNPYSIVISGFSSLEDAITNGEKIAAKYGEGEPACTFGGKFDRTTFERIRASFEGRPGPWKVATFGALAKQATAALKGEISSQTPQGPIPAFEWHTAKTEEQVFAAITVEGSDVYLEVAVEHRAECDLIAEVAFLSGFDFEVVAWEAD